jgi:NAD-dependent dihydropyrimidine dehydrogenase PreA subunit
MEVTRKIVEINEELCDGCGQCVPACAEGAIEVEDGKARLVAEKYCDGLGACLGECPQGAITVVEREAEEFDEEAVEAYLDSKAQEGSPEEASLARGCPSTRIQSFSPPESFPNVHNPPAQKASVSALTHWPVQIRLVPPTAPFLKGADLLVAADCTPIAYPSFHRDFLEGKVVMMGCPKFDEIQDYIRRFADIFRTSGIKSVTVVDMEVPCCSALPVIVKRGMAAAGKDIPIEEITISTRGNILKRASLAGKKRGGHGTAPLVPCKARRFSASTSLIHRPRP